MNRVLGDKRAIAILLGPALLLYTAVMLIPMLWSLGYTFFTGSVVGGFTFTGFSNFVRLFSDPNLVPAILFTFKYAIVITVGQIFFGYLLALLYHFYLKRASGILRTLVFFPVVLPTVAVALLFQQLFEYAPQTGLVNSVLNAVGIHSIDWLGTAGNAFIVIAILDIWRSMGFYGVLLFTGLLDIPEEVVESARIDGAGGWRLVRHIVLPLSAPILVSSLIFSINGTLKVFDSIYALTGGGPGNGTTPLTLYMFTTSFTAGDYGYGATIALVLTIICLMVTALIFRAVRSEPKVG
jgi:multiple sugar transport system permease protein/raffinose/stachyose/melibiose transport system permease protein